MARVSRIFSFLFIAKRIDNMEESMSALTEAVQGLVARITEDFANMRSLLDQALATRAEDKAEIARLTAQADALQAELQSSIDAINAVDPDPAYPVAAEPDDGTPADEEEPVQG